MLKEHPVKHVKQISTQEDLSKKVPKVVITQEFIKNKKKVTILTFDKPTNMNLPEIQKALSHGLNTSCGIDKSKTAITAPGHHSENAKSILLKKFNKIFISPKDVRIDNKKAK